MEDLDMIIVAPVTGEEPVCVQAKVPRTLEDCARDQVNLSNCPGYIKSLIISEVNDSDASAPGWKDRTNIFFEKFYHENEELQNTTSLKLNHLWLDDWEPLLESLKHHDNLDQLILNQCFLTERGAHILGNLLYEFANKHSPRHLLIDRNMPDAGWHALENIVLINLQGCSSWIHAHELCPIEYKTVIEVSFHCADDDDDNIQIHNLDPIKQAELRELPPDTRGGFEDVIVHIDTRDQVTGEEESEDQQIVKLVFNENQHFSLNLCRGIGHILRQTATLMQLSVDSLKEADLPYDFMKDADKCIKLELDESHFDPQTVASIMKFREYDTIEDDISFMEDHKELTFINLFQQDMAKIETLLDLVDISSLGLLKLIGYHHRTESSADLNPASRAFSPLYRQLAENKGPKKLAIYFHQDDMNDFGPQLALGLTGNDKISDLEITAQSCVSTSNDDYAGFKQLLDAMDKMPHLRFVSIQWRENEENLDPEIVKKWNKWILDLLRSNWSIHSFRVSGSFELDFTTYWVLMQNKRLRHLLPMIRQQESLSSGIWPLALSRIRKDEDVLFRVLKEMPGLFQQAAESSSSSQKSSPCVSVPHHSDCRPQQKQYASQSHNKRPKLI